MIFTTLAVAALVASASAADSFCDKYTKALFVNNTGENQLKLMTTVVNTVVIGNWTATPTGKSVPGILANFTVNGQSWNLLKYFNGAGATTNSNGNPAQVNFLDGGAAAPLQNSKPANDDAQSSNQYRLLTHLYQGFGALLGCTGEGFPSYEGRTSMYEAHKFMNISKAENDYFISQVALAASAYGVADEDLAPVGNLLETAFNNNCNATSPLVPGSSLPAERQGFCLGKGCTCPAGSGSTSGNNSTTTTNSTVTARASPTASATTGSGSGAGALRTGVTGFLGAAFLAVYFA